MKRYRRNTVRYKGVKVRYSHLFLVKVNSQYTVEYTTTEVDEMNLSNIKKAFGKRQSRK